MTQEHEKSLKKVAFQRIAHSSAKRYIGKKGELVLTRDHLSINCEGSLSKAFRILEVSLEAKDEKLEVYDRYGRLRFALAIDKAEEVKEAFDNVQMEISNEAYLRFWKMEEEQPKELEKLLDLSPSTVKKLYDDTRKERQQFGEKNIRFNLDIQRSWLWDGTRDRKLKAFIVAHSYVAWYEWTKRLLVKIYKTKFGKGPKNDEELMKFLDEYPSLKSLLDTTQWGIRANQIRNCVSHEKFYFDYKNSELVFMTTREKRVRLRDLRTKILPMSHFYVTVIRSLVDKVQSLNVGT